MTHQPLIFLAPAAGLTWWTHATAGLMQWIASAGIIVLCVSILLCLARIVRGPTLADRGAALDVLGVQLVGIIILLTIRTGSLLFVDGILIVSLLAFAGTIAVAQFIARPFMRDSGAETYRGPSVPDLPPEQARPHPDSDDPSPGASEREPA